MSHDRELEYRSRRAHEGPEREPHREREDDFETREGEHQELDQAGVVLAAMHEILAEGTLRDELFAELGPEAYRALEALQAARNGSAYGMDRGEFGYVSALERGRLLEGALVELQPILAAAASFAEGDLSRELEAVREGVEESRRDIAQRLLLETTRGSVKRRDSDEDQDEDDDSDGDDEGDGDPSRESSL